MRTPRNRCPRCGEALLRVRRRPEDLQLQHAVPTRRYSCTSGACDWQGMVPISLDLYGRGQRRSLARWRLQPWMLGTLVFAVAAASAAWGVARLHRASQQVPGLALGESHDGVPLPPSHPLRRRLAAATAPQPADAAAAATAGAAVAASLHAVVPAPADGEPAATVAASAAASAPASGAAAALIQAAAAAASAPRQVAGSALDLRQGCAWGQPGRSPYRGTVEEALHAARVPAEVVRQIAHQVKARQVVDRLRISTGSIRGQAGGREFEPRSMAMSFGRTLCLQTRVNFVPGHVEEADLYEASDGGGRKYAVMVPDVCGNVSVLGVRGEREDPLLAAAEGQGAAAAPNQVPEPGSLASTLAALLALWAVWRRGRARPAKLQPDRDRKLR